jgi:hypothetical protein
VPIICALGSLSSGATATVTIVVRPSAPGTLTNQASVSANTTDPKLANNSATATTSVASAPPPPPPPSQNCAPSYPTVCIPPPPPDLDCKDISYRNFQVRYDVPDPDPHHFDGDHDGVGCEE